MLAWHIFQSKIRPSRETTLQVHIGTVKFATQFKESPCSPVVTFPSFGSEGMALNPIGELLFLMFV